MSANTSRSKARASVRYSTYSVTAPSLAATMETNDSRTNEIRDIATGLDRMENKALSSQRVFLTEEKTTNMQKLALGAKLDRALERRMSGQDAVMRPRKATLTGGVNSAAVPANYNDKEVVVSEKAE